MRNVPLRTHWLLLTALVSTLSAALLLQGYAHHMFDTTADGAPRGAGSSASVPEQIRSGALSSRALPGGWPVPGPARSP